METMKDDMGGAASILAHDEGDRPAEAEDQRDRGDPVQREHAERLGAEARRRDHASRRQDLRGAEHRRRGPARAGRRARVPGREEAVADRRHRDPHRGVHGRARHRHHRRDGQRRRSDRGGSIAAGEAVGEPIWQLPLHDDYRAADRLHGRRHQEHRRSLRRRDHRGLVPGGVRRRHAVGAPGHRRARRSPTGRPTSGRAGGTGVPVRTLVRFVLDRAAAARGSGGRRHRGDRASRGAPHRPRPRGLRASRRRRDLRRAACSRSGPPPDARSTCSCSRTATADRSDPPRDRAELAATRAAETEAAGRVLGLASVRILAIARRRAGEHCRGPRGRGPPDPRGARRDRAERRPDRRLLREPLLQPLAIIGRPGSSRSTRRSRAPATRTSSPSTSARASRRPGGAPTCGSAGRTSPTTSRT